MLVNVVVAVLMKHLEESNKRDADEAKKLAEGLTTDGNRTDTEGANEETTEAEKEDTDVGLYYIGIT